MKWFTGPDTNAVAVGAYYTLAAPAFGYGGYYAQLPWWGIALLMLIGPGVLFVLLCYREARRLRRKSH